jgi:hypothetical protein
VLRRLAVLPLIAALLFLPGCFWWMAPMAVSGSSSSGSGSREYTPDEVGMTNVRASIPAIEAYYADNGTYKGATLEVLQQRYDAGVQGIRIVKANGRTYCIESDTGGFPWHKAGPAADIVPGNCGTELGLIPGQTDADMCVESTIDDVTYYRVGPDGEAFPGRCPN